MMDVALGSASALSAVELDLLAVDRETSDRWFAVHHCSRKCSRSQTHHLLMESAARLDRGHDRIATLRRWLTRPGGTRRVVLFDRELAVTIAPFDVGEIRCLPLSDGEYPASWEELFPGAPDDRLQRWFRDHPHADREEPSASNCLLVQTPGGTALLDTGFGALAAEFGLPTAGRLQTALREHDVSVDDVDLVVLSHAHPDHIGGTIDFGGEEPVPAFPRARYVMAGAEWRFWSSDEAPAGMVSVVRPRLDALERTDRIELSDGEMEVLPGLRLLPAPGHTPGHLALAITSGREGALYLGDAFVHESQFAHPDLDAVVDTLPGVTTRTRRRLLEQAVREGRSVVAFHMRRIGSVTASGDAFTFEPEGDQV